MPVRPTPKPLRMLCLDCLALNLEVLCYGVEKGSKKLMEIVESDLYKVST